MPIEEEGSWSNPPLGRPEIKIMPWGRTDCGLICLFLFALYVCPVCPPQSPCIHQIKP